MTRDQLKVDVGHNISQLQGSVYYCRPGVVLMSAARHPFLNFSEIEKNREQAKGHSGQGLGTASEQDHR